jgi:hypothetical protein
VKKPKARQEGHADPEAPAGAAANFQNGSQRHKDDCGFDRAVTTRQL